MSGKSFRFPAPAQWTLLSVVAAIATLLCIVMVAMDWHSIVAFDFHDPDDALRYVEARDFAAGQNWFDVSQHRVNPPLGGPMHWSRLVDLPISGLMLLLRPLFGVVMADRLAMVAVPLMLTYALCFMTALAVRRLGGTSLGIVAALMIACSTPILLQFQPMRIDHHGWQILMATVALWATFDTRLPRSGVIAGLAIAFWTHVSSEGLPYAALFGGVFVLAFIREEKNWVRVVAYAAALTVGSALLLLGTRGWPEAGKPYCDAVSPVYLIPMAAAALMLPLAHRLIGSRTALQRMLIPVLAVAVCAIVYLAMGSPCHSGPFSTLDPFVYKNWYLHVAEGRPVWEQSRLMAAIVILPPIIGLFGTAMALRNAPDARSRFSWLVMLLLALGAYSLSLFVLRAFSISYLFMLPGIAALILKLLPKAQGFRTAPARVFATVALCFLTPINLSVIAAGVPDDVSSTVKNKGSDTDTASPCVAKATLQGIAALPPGNIMAPLDIGPHLLAFTPHSVVATGHHRNPAIRDVMLTFLGTPSQARALLDEHHVKYVAYCDDLAEVDNYIKTSPKGFMAMLENNTPPPWLTPIPMRPGESIRVYRVTPPAKR